MSITHPNVDTLRKVYSDLSCIGSYVADSVILHPATRATETGADAIVGKAAVVAWERELIRSTGGTLVMQVEHVVANDHFGTVLGVLNAQFERGAFSQAFCGLWRFSQEKIVEHWENIYDPALLEAHS